MSKRAILPLLLFPFFAVSMAFAQQNEQTLDAKGAIIIAGLEGQVTVTNNQTNVALPADSVKQGGLIFDGHTVKTGPSSKIILLLSNGTVTTVKADSALNIKKFTQAKFNPGETKLAELEGEPSSSDTVLDLEVGDLVVDIKKLDKKSSFNIESPVGTAGIRGTRVGMNIRPAPGGGFTSNIVVPKGLIDFTPPPPPPPPPGTSPRHHQNQFQWLLVRELVHLFHRLEPYPPLQFPHLPHLRRLLQSMLI